jgi:post-segregation antitoxin (ccd killing protein)
MIMAGFARVTVTLPDELIQEIDRREKNRSKFVAEAVRREVERVRRAELRRSLANPHAESTEFAEEGLEDWNRSLPEEDTETLVNLRSGEAVQWIRGKGWIEKRR